MVSIPKTNLLLKIVHLKISKFLLAQMIVNSLAYLFILGLATLIMGEFLQKKHYLAFLPELFIIFCYTKMHFNA